jgi:hypothetical protein
MTRNKLCCEPMEKASFKEDIVDYDSILRLYTISSNSKKIARKLIFCPWCGIDLKKSLSFEFYEILENEYNFRLSEIQDDFSNVPPEFQSDAWWKKRGL